MAAVAVTTPWRLVSRHTSGMTSSIHPLDEALALTSSAPGQFTGQTHPGYWNMVGPFGGVTAATLLQAVMQHPTGWATRLSLTVNYAGALTAGPYTGCRPRPCAPTAPPSTAPLTILQADAEGAQVVTTTATAVTGPCAATPGARAMCPCPPCPAPRPSPPSNPARSRGMAQPLAKCARHRRHRRAPDGRWRPQPDPAVDARRTTTSAGLLRACLPGR